MASKTEKAFEDLRGAVSDLSKDVTALLRDLESVIDFAERHKGYGDSDHQWDFQKAWDIHHCEENVKHYLHDAAESVHQAIHLIEALY